MDDLKTYAKSDSQQTGLLNIVKTFSNDIKMEFGLDKCAKATFKRGKLTETSDLQLDIDTCIKELDQEDTYKYLGVDEGDGIQHAKMKERVRKEYYGRVRMVLKTELNAANRFEDENGNDTSYHWSTWSYQKGTRNLSWKNPRPIKHQ